MVESSSLEFIVPCWWHHDHVTETWLGHTWAAKALKKLKEEKEQIGLDFEVHFWGALVVRWHFGKLFVFFGLCVLVFQLLFNRSLRQIGLVRHIAPALVQADGEDQCDSISVQVLEDRYQNVRNTLTGFFKGLIASKGSTGVYQVLRCEKSLQNCTFSFATTFKMAGSSWNKVVKAGTPECCHAR